MQRMASRLTGSLSRHALRGLYTPFRSLNVSSRAVQEPPSSPSPAEGQQRPRPAMPARPPAGRAPPRGPPVPLGPDGQPLEVVPVEKAGAEAWAGVAAIDDGKQFDWSRALGMAGGDALALLVFAVIGRINHGEVLDIETLATAAPFLAGWFLTAPFLGGYGPEAQGAKVGPAALAAAKCWAVATPLGLVIRGVTKGYVPPTPFIIVSMAATAVVMIGWRSALAATTKEATPQSAAQQIAARKDKQGNPFEFLQLLMSLTKRW